jgi:hypothetical protein
MVAELAHAHKAKELGFCDDGVVEGIDESGEPGAKPDFIFSRNRALVLDEQGYGERQQVPDGFGASATHRYCRKPGPPGELCPVTPDNRVKASDLEKGGALF